MNTFCTASAFMGLNMNMCDSTVISTRVEQQFIEHISSYGISYGTAEEYKFRLNIFATKDIENEEINANPENTFTVGHNMFSTWTAGEYKKLLGAKVIEPTNVQYLDASNNSSSVDWRQKGAVNAVKNQGQCGSCWAFSAVAAVEGHHAIKSGKLESFAEQEIVDCDKTSYGCNGGCDGSCKYDASKGTTKVSTYANVPASSVDQLKAAIAKGPTSVTIEADQACFQRYTSGVFNDKSCGTSLDHAVTAVGYGTDAGQDFYIVRNSWGSSWGEKGYIRMAAVSGSGICGIQMQSLWPTTN